MAKEANVFVHREMSEIEFRGVMLDKIPFCDEFGEFNSYGLAVVKKDERFGVVNTEPELVIPIEYDAVKLLDNGYIMIRANDSYLLRTQSGAPFLHPPFESEEAAIKYANNL